MKTQENSSLMSLQKKAFVETKVARLLGHTKPPSTETPLFLRMQALMLKPVTGSKARFPPWTTTAPVAASKRSALFSCTDRPGSSGGVSPSTWAALMTVLRLARR